MADIFRLLSRSTSLGKKAHNRPTQVTAPSLPLPQVLPASSSSSVASSKKKKRRKANEDILELAPELDFFGTAEHKKKELREKSKKRKRCEDDDCDDDDAEGEAEDKSSSESESEDEEDRGAALKSNIQGGATTQAVEPLAEEARRKLMKGHKLKLTLLNPPEPPAEKGGEEENKGRKKKRQRKSKEKEKAKEKAKRTQLQSTHLLTSFDHLRLPPYNLSRRLFANLLVQGYKIPTPVQLSSLPLLLLNYSYEQSGNVIQAAGGGKAFPNIVTCAPTGSGKTLAFLLPVLSWALGKRASIKTADGNPAGIKAIILAPTKELVGQIHNEGLKLSLNTSVRVSVLQKSFLPKEKREKHDGESSEEEQMKEENGYQPKSTIKSDILVSTPGMLLHALDKGAIDYTMVERLILDEADVLLEKDSGSGFGKETLSIWEILKSGPRSRDIRVWMWSATISSGVEELAGKMIADSSRTNGDTNEQDTRKKKKKNSKKSSTTSSSPSSEPTQPPLLRLLVGLKNTSLPTIAHKLIYTATEPGKLLSLRQLFSTSFPPPCLIFTQTIPRAQALYNEIQYDLPFYAPGRIAVLHSNLSDSMRADIMDRFRGGQIWILVTTDLLSRGVDFRGVNVVVNYDIPTSAASYVHRAGRTGRAGREGGLVYTYYTKEDIKYVKVVANIITESEKAQRNSKPASTQWLLNYLPKVSKEEKKRLKKFGVEQRRVGLPEGKGKAVVGARISTKPGWEKQREDRKRKAIEASKRRQEVGSEGRREKDRRRRREEVQKGDREWGTAETFNEGDEWESAEVFNEGLD